MSGLRCAAFAWAVLLAVLALGVPTGTDRSDMGWTRYQLILDREPFGRVPKPGDPGTEAPPEPEPEPEDTGPGLAETVRLSVITNYGGKPAAGFTDTTTGRSFYLFEGQSIEDFMLVSVEVGGDAATLRKGSKEARIQIGSGAAAPKPTMPGGPAQATGVRQPEDTLSYAVRHRQRIEEARARAEEARRRDEEEQRRKEAQVERLTGEALQKHLREYNLQLIRTGAEPPLPIELTPEEVQQLAAEGYDVSLPENPPGSELRNRRRLMRPDVGHGMDE